MKFFLIITIALAALSPASAQKADVKTDPAVTMNPNGLTIEDCISILTGLNALDGRQVIVNAGKPNEAAVSQPYEFGNAVLRGDIADNIATLTMIQKASQDAQQKIFFEVAKGDAEIKTGSAKGIEYDRQLRALTSRPCLAQLKKIKTSDLKLDKNEIPSSVLAMIEKIREK